MSEFVDRGKAVCVWAEMVLTGTRNIGEHARLKTRFKRTEFLMMDAMPQRFYLKNHRTNNSRFVFRYDFVLALVEPIAEKLHGYSFFQVRNSSDGIHY